MTPMTVSGSPANSDAVPWTLLLFNKQQCHLTNLSSNRFPSPTTLIYDKLLKLYCFSTVHGCSRDVLEPLHRPNLAPATGPFAINRRKGAPCWVGLLHFSLSR